MNKTKTVLSVAALLAAFFLPVRGHAADPVFGIIDEVRGGVAGHDVPFLGDHKEPGADINAEIQFVSPFNFGPLFSPRPHIGVMANTAEKTSWAYAGLTWSYDFLQGRLRPNDGGFFTDLELGGATHTDTVGSYTPNRKGMGTRLLFHEDIDLGYRFTPHIGLAMFLDHISNANTGNRNPGITDAGLRVSYKF